MADLLITGGTLVAMDAERRVIRDGAVATRGSQIAAVGKADELGPRFPNAERIDARQCVILPGLIDTHQHTTEMPARGLADDVPFFRWMFDRMLPTKRR